MIEQRPPTHHLTVRVPLHVGPDGPPDLDPFRDAIRAILPLTLLWASGALCDSPEVTVVEATPEAACPE